MKILLLVPLSLVLAGCGTTKVTRYGDVTLQQQKDKGYHALGATPNINWTLRIPQVPLSRTGSHTFPVRGMKENIVPTTLTLRSPHHRKSLDKLKLAGEWGNATFRITLTNTRSGARFRHTFQPSKMNWGSAITDQDGASFTVSLTDQRFDHKWSWSDWKNATDYNIAIDVLVPTRSGTHSLELTGSATSPYGMGPPLQYFR